MPDVKQILVVDDHFEMLEFLRSMLETQSQDFQVLSVPSAEEGLLELLRTPFDLLITDLRLPGMSGFDLVRKVNQRMPDLPMIMITAYASEQGRKEAADLGVFRYFEKPLDTDSLIAAVKIALGEETGVEAVDESVPAEVTERVQSLRSETSAVKVVLADIAGQVLLDLGAGDVPVAMENLAPRLAHNVRDSLIVADQLGGDAPFSVQYHAGSQLEMYSANIGRHYFVSVFFAVEARRSRFSTIWVYLQRAVNDLVSLLPAPEILLADAVEAAGMAEPESAVASTVAVEPSRVDTKPLRPAPDGPAEVPEQGAMAPDEAMSLVDLDLDFISQENIAKDEAGADIEAFWDDAISGTKSDSESGRLSIDEARRQGLLSSDFDIESDE